MMAINSYDVAANDNLNFYNGETAADGSRIVTLSGGKTLPTPFKTSAQSSLVTWSPNNDGVNGKGYGKQPNNIT